MAGPDPYNSPVDFRIPQTPPPDTPIESLSTFKLVFYAIQQIIFTFTYFCGIGQFPPQKWALLSGSPSTLLRHNLGRFYTVAKENIAQGAAVNLVMDLGILKVQNANATTGAKPCDGFCTTIGGITSGSIGEVVLSQGTILMPGATLTAGQRYWLDTSAGGLKTSAPVAAGNIEQYLGIAIDTTHLYFNTHYWIQH